MTRPVYALPPPVWRHVRRAAVWTALVSACAAPLAILLWGSLDTAERLAVGSGVLVWIVVMAIVTHRPRWPGLDRRMRRGALAMAAITIAAASIEPPYSLVVVYLPAIQLGSPIIRATPLEQSDLATVFMLTVICGAQVAVCAWGLGRLIDLLLPSRRMRR
jgi:hypothetical protein